MTAPDGLVDMRDFRRFRDAWLQLCVAEPGNDPGCPSGSILLDGDPQAPKRDLNFDGCAQPKAMPPAHGPCRNNESVQPRFDFNGDGRLTLADPMPMPLTADGNPAPDMASATMMTDLQVLASQFTPSSDGWTAADLPDLMQSGDVTIDAHGAFAAGATGLVVSATHPNLADRGVSSTITPEQPVDVITVLADQDVKLTATAQFPAGDEVVFDELLAPLAPGEDRWVSACGTIQLEVSQSSVGPGGTIGLTATVDPCTPLPTPALPITVNLTMTPSGTSFAILPNPAPQTDALGVATTAIQVGSELTKYTITATADIGDGGDPNLLHGETSFVVDADYEIEVVASAPAGGTSVLGSGPGIADDGSVAYVTADPAGSIISVRAEGATASQPLAGSGMAAPQYWLGQLTVTDGSTVWGMTETVTPEGTTGAFQRRREVIAIPVTGGTPQTVTKSHLHLLGATDSDADYQLVGLPAPNETGGVVYLVDPLGSNTATSRVAAPGTPDNLLGPAIGVLPLDPRDAQQPAHADTGQTAVKALLSAGDPLNAAEAIVVGADVLGIDNTFDAYVLAVDPINNDALLLDENGDPMNPSVDPYLLTTPAFTALGDHVAMSSDGRVIAFLGDEGDGPGLYLFLRPDPLGAVFEGPLLVMGANDLEPTPDLGVDGNGQPLYFSDWSLDQPIAVSHVQDGVAGLAGDRLVVAFEATPVGAGERFSAFTGLWTTRIELAQTPLGIVPDPDRPVAAVQVGDMVSRGTITDLGTWDPLAGGSQFPVGGHQLTWWQQLSTGEQQIVRATRITDAVATAEVTDLTASAISTGTVTSAARSFERGDEVVPYNLAAFGDPVPPGPGAGAVARLPELVVDTLTLTLGDDVLVTNRSRDTTGTPVAATLTTSLGGSPKALSAGGLWSVTPTTEGPLTLSLTTNDGTDSLTTTIVVQVGPAPNRPPEAQLDGPWIVPDGGRVVFDGSDSSDPDAGDSIVLYEWDFNADGNYDDFTGPMVDLSVAEFEALACVAGCARDIPMPIALKVTDSHGIFDLAGSNLTLSSDPADFILSIDPASQFMNPGAITELLVKVTGEGGFADPVDLTVDPLPAGWSASLTPSTVTPNGTSILRVVPAADAPEADFDISVTGTSGSISHTTSSTASVTFALIPICYAGLQGRVTDATTGEPITTDRVFVTAEDDLGLWSVSALLDGEGRYSIADVPITTRLLVRATAYPDAGYQVTPLTLHQTVCDATLVVDIQMQKTEYGTVIGRIVEGIPDPTNLTAGRKLFPTDIPVAGATATVDSIHMTTGADGTFRIENIPLGSQNAPRTLAVSGGGNAYWGTQVNTTVSEGVVVDVGDLPVVERCSTMVRVSGIVHDSNGDPISTGVSLEFQPTILSNADGTFEIGPVEVTLNANNGERTLYVQANPPFYGGYGDTQYLTFSECDALVDEVFELEVEAVPPPPPVDNLGVVEGRVLDERTNAGIPNAQVRLFKAGVYTQDSAITDANGHFQLDDVLVGTGDVVSDDRFSLRAGAVSYWESDYSPEFTVSKDQTTTTDITLVPIDKATATGVVVDKATGDPIEQALVSVGGGAATTAADGTFAITGLIPDAVNLPKVVTTYAYKSYGNVGTPGRWYTSWGEAVLVPGGTTNLRFELVPVCEDVSISGLVLDASTRLPLEGAQVSAPSLAVLTGADGTFVLEGVELGVNNAPATVTVTARKSGYITLSKHVTVYCGAHVSVDFGTADGGIGSISGTVTDQASGNPIEGVFVGSAFGGTDTTDELGHYRLDDVPVNSDGTPRDWDLDVVGPRGTTAQATVTVAADEETIRDFVLAVPVNQVPVADPQSIVALVDTSVGINLTGSDPDGDPLTFQIVTGPAAGTLSGSGPARIYTPNPGTTVDSFTFTVSDGELTSSPATVSIALSEPTNSAPEVSVDDASGDVGSPIMMTATATDYDGDPLSLAWSVDSTDCSFSDDAVLTPTLTCTVPGIYSATLAADDGELTGSDSGVVTVLEAAPIVSVDDVSGETGSPIMMSATATDPDGDPLSLAWSVDSTDCSFFDDSIVDASLTCTVPGIYTVTLVADDGARTGSDTAQVTVTQPNRPPIVSVDDVSGETGSPIMMSATATDPDGDPLSLAWSVDSADCSFSDDSIVDASLTCTAVGIYTVTLVADDGARTGSDTAQVTVTQPNRPPEVMVDDVSGETGLPIMMSATATDPDGDPLLLQWLVDDQACVFSNPRVLLPSLTCTTPGAYQVALAAFDGRRNTQDSATVTVTDVPENDPPTITSDPTASVPENQTAAIDVEATDDTDSEGDGLSYAITGGVDALRFDIDPDTGVVTFKVAPDFELPADANTDNHYELQVTVTDSGAMTDVADITVTVTDVPENDPPTITSDPTASVPENQTAAIDVEATDDTDSEGDGLSYAITGGVDALRFDIDPDTGVVTFKVAPDFELPADANTDNHYELQVTVTDSGALTDVADITVTVTDVPENADTEGPVTSLVESTPNPALLNAGVSLSAYVDDTTTGGSIIAAAEYSIDDGPFVALVAADGGLDAVAEGVVATIPAASFPESGVYRVCVRGVDLPGNIGSTSCVLVVVYDPDGGFITGGGWIESPEGAYAADPAVTGRANFGFVAKYKKGRSVPDGQTEFMFTAGSLNFHSTSYDYLVVNKGSSRAQFKGTGTINGAGEFKFIIWATDGDVRGDGPDTFRIRIWDDSNGIETVIYDNGSDQALSGGNVTIHAAK